MSKKSISFGKINFKLNKTTTSETNETSGFGTFGRTPIQEQKEIEEIAEDLESQHVHQIMGIKNFGKKAKNFNIDELMEQAKQNAEEINKNRLEAEKNNKISEELENDNVIGPLPPNLPNTGSDSEGEIGPPIPSNLVTSSDKEAKNNEKEDSYDELSGSDDEEVPLEKRIPNSHEVSIPFFRPELFSS